MVARSLHSHSSIVDLNDYEETVKFVLAEIKELNNEVISSFKFGN
jgi:putative aminopeptidase FrvX